MPAPNSLYFATVMADKPIRLYPLNESSGSVAYDYAGGQSGTYGSSGFTRGQPGLIARDASTCVSFAGSSSQAILLPMTGLPTGNQPWSIETWVSLSTLTPGSQRGVPLGFGTYLANEMAELQYFALRDQWVLSCFSNDIGSAFSGAAQGATHLVGTFDGTATRLYANGILTAGPHTTTLAIALAFANIGAGNTSGSSDFLTGAVQYAAIYNFALSAAQVQTHYQVGTGQLTTLTVPTASPLVTGPTPTSLYLYKQQVVLVYNSSGTFIDTWRDAPLLAGFKEGINQVATPIRVQLPRRFDSFDEAGTTGARGSIAQGNVVQYWLFGPGLPVGGLLRYQGIIDKYEPQIAESGEESLTVTITPFGSVLGDGGLTTSQAFGTPGVSASYQDPCAIFRWFFQNNDPTTGNPYASPLVLDTPSQTVASTVKAQYTMQNQSVGSSLQTAIQLLYSDSPNWFFRANPDKTVTLAKAPATAQHQFILGQHLSAPQYAKDWTQLRNVIQVIGTVALNITLNAQINSGANLTSITVSSLPIQLVAGQFLIINNGGSTSQTVQVNATAAAGSTTVTVVSFTANATYTVGTPIGVAINAVKTGADIATFGKRLLQLADNRITDQATANLMASALLTLKDQMLLRTKIRLIDYRGDIAGGLGYDIESIKVGDTCQIIDPLGNTNVTLWDQAIWDTSVWDYAPGAALAQVAQIVDLSYGFDYIDCSLAAFPPSQDRAVLQLQQALLQYFVV